MLQGLSVSLAMDLLGFGTHLSLLLTHHGVTTLPLPGSLRSGTALNPLQPGGTLVTRPCGHCHLICS